VLINGVLIGSLFAVIAIGDKLGGAWVLLFPVWLLILFAGAMLWQRRNPSRAPKDMRPVRLVVFLTAVVTGLALGGPSYALVAAIGAGLAILLLLGVERLRSRAAR
jgi:nitrate/nitrite transporter NarK